MQQTHTHTLLTLKAGNSTHTHCASTDCALAPSADLSLRVRQCGGQESAQLAWRSSAIGGNGDFSSAERHVNKLQTLLRTFSELHKCTQRSLKRAYIAACCSYARKTVCAFSACLSARPSVRLSFCRQRQQKERPTNGPMRTTRMQTREQESAQPQHWR